jgi:hypothetical protein
MKISDFLNSKGRVSSTRATEKYVLKIFPIDHSQICILSKKLGIEDRTFSEKIYHYLLGLNSKILCKNCLTNKTKFQGLSSGYLDYCSSQCSNSSIEVKKLKEKSYIKNYGVSNPSKSPEILEKIQKSFVSKYGDNPFKIEEFKERIKRTNLERYGTESPLANGSSVRSRINDDLAKRFLEKYKDFEVIEMEVKKWGSTKLLCKKCGNHFEISKWNLHQRNESGFINPCTICSPIGTAKSGLEDFIRSELDRNDINYEEKDRKILKGKEIDFLIPEFKIGIEVDGIFWHSNKFKDNQYHKVKTELAEEMGIKLIHVFEDEIVYKKDLVKSRIESILGIYKEKIYARKCQIREVDPTTANNFLEINHMQGRCGAKIRLGLFYKDRLVSLMTFGDMRKNLGKNKTEGHWELIRFCNEKGVSVIGGASKLLSNFIEKNKPKKITSYCDRRWSDGKFYQKLGFSLEAKTPPNYWYFSTNDMKRQNRFKYRKDILVRDGYDPLQSEASIMHERGFFRIYDCGNFRFTLSP